MGAAQGYGDKKIASRATMIGWVETTVSSTLQDVCFQYDQEEKAGKMGST